MHILVDALGPTLDTAGLLEGSVVVYDPVEEGRRGDV
jgi:hypothetical protein